MKRILLFLACLCATATAFGQGSTPNIGLQIPATGSNNWYIPLNFNFTKLDCLLSGNCSVPAFAVTGNIIVGGSVTANSFIGAGGAGFALSPGAFPNSVPYFSGSNPSRTLSGVSITGIPYYNPSSPPSALTTSQFAAFLQPQTNCNTSGYAYSPQSNTCVNFAAPGSYITALTGDVTASGPGSAVATVVKVNGVPYPTAPSISAGALLFINNINVASYISLGAFPSSITPDGGGRSLGNSSLRWSNGFFITTDTTNLKVGSGPTFSSVQGTTGTKIPAATGTFVNGNLRSTNSTGDEIDAAVAVAALFACGGTCTNGDIAEFGSSGLTNSPLSVISGTVTSSDPLAVVDGSQSWNTTATSNSVTETLASGTYAITSELSTVGSGFVQTIWNDSGADPDQVSVQAAPNGTSIAAVDNEFDRANFQVQSGTVQAELLDTRSNDQIILSATNTLLSFMGGNPYCFGDSDPCGVSGHGGVNMADGDGCLATFTQSSGVVWNCEPDGNGYFEADNTMLSYHAAGYDPQFQAARWNPFSGYTGGGFHYYSGNSYIFMDGGQFGMSMGTDDDGHHTSNFNDNIDGQWYSDAWAGTGNRYLCVDSSGHTFTSATVCHV